MRVINILLSFAQPRDRRRRRRRRRVRRGKEWEYKRLLCVSRTIGVLCIHLRREDRRDESGVYIQDGPREEDRRKTTIKTELKKTSTLLKTIVNGTKRWSFSTGTVFRLWVQHDSPIDFANFRFYKADNQSPESVVRFVRFRRRW